MEILGTFMFVLFILFVTGKKTQVPDLVVWGIPGICLNLWALCNVVNYTAPSFNPALAVGQSIFAYMWWRDPINGDYLENRNEAMTYLPYYFIGAAAGGIMAGLFYHFLAGFFPDKR